MANLKTLQKACANNDIGLIECEDNTTKKKVVLICAFHAGDKEEIEITPLAKAFEENPYERYSLPK